MLVQTGRSMNHLLNKPYFIFSNSKANIIQGEGIENELSEIPYEIMIHIFSFFSDKDICLKVLTLEVYILNFFSSNIIFRGHWGAYNEHFNEFIEKFQTTFQTHSTPIIGSLHDAFVGAKIYATSPNFRSKCVYWP